MANKISVIIDVAVDKASASLKNFRQDIAKAEGASGKLKAGWSAASTAIAANAGALAASAGAALVSFGVKSVQAFQDTALAARDFSNATGIAVEDASRLIEVAGDFGVEASAVEGAVMKMNKALADGKPVFEQYGVEIAKTDSGLVDANQTFINAITTIGKIQDPTKRAQAAQQAFGKSYGEVSRFMAMSAEELQEALAGVSEQQAISEEEAKRAEEFELAMDELRDTLTKVSTQVGGDLVPVLTTLAKTFTAIQNAIPKDDDSFFGQLYDAANEAINPWERFKGALEDIDELFGSSSEGVDEVKTKTQELATQGLDPLAASSEEAAAMQEYYASRADAAAEATARAKRETQEYDAAYRSLMGNLDKRESWRNVEDALAELDAKIDDGETSWAELGEATDDALKAMAEYIIGLEDLPREVKTDLLAKLDEGDLETVRKVLQGLQNGVTVPVRFARANSIDIEKRAKGGPVRAGQPYIVGEEGPELVVPAQSGTVLNAGQTREALLPVSASGSGAGAGPITVNIYPKALPTDRELIDLVNSVRRRNGNVI